MDADVGAGHLAQDPPKSSSAVGASLGQPPTTTVMDHTASTLPTGLRGSALCEKKQWAGKARPKPPGETTAAGRRKRVFF